MATISYRDPGTQEFVPFVTTPVGTIVGFGGSVAPAGWHLCDGTPHYSPELDALIGPNTPNLQDRFIIGAGGTRAVGVTGGASMVRLSGPQSGMPAHNHTASTNSTGSSHTHSGTFASAGGHHHYGGYVMTGTKNTTINNDSGGPNWVLRNYGLQITSGAHTHAGGSSGFLTNQHHVHTVTINNATATTGADHENRPPYYSLVYIVKV